MLRLAATRRYWLPQVIALGVLALVATLPFWVTDLDLRVAGHFFDATAADPWVESQDRRWALLYQAASILSTLVLVAGLAVLLGGTLLRRFRGLRRYALFVVAVFILGPGLVVNSVFKEHWGRPRPYQVTEFGGASAYLPPLMKGEDRDGKSFPSGHSSVGFSLVAFALIWLRRRPWLAAVAFVLALAAGGGFGLARMAVGDHFLSDVLWSAVMIYAVALALYYGILDIPGREDRARLRSAAAPLPDARFNRAAAGLAGLALAVGVLFATPLSQTETWTLRAVAGVESPRVLRRGLDEGQVILYWVGADANATRIRLRARDYGLFGSRVAVDKTTTDGLVDYRLRHLGVFTMTDTLVVVALVPGAWDRVEVHTGRGDIQVLPSSALRPKLDLTSGDGRVLGIGTDLP
ncbi:MAG TPA: phosphatase PAP2 family protein [Chromatiaceae bacterium]|nr:phosphatase PAP2 family protein [Chromatiaceae bacterium]